MYYVYKHTSPSGKVYIGITKQSPPSKRWLGGQGYRTQQKFWAAITKYGWGNFTHEILCVFENADDAECAERRYIEEYKSYDNRYGYNIEHGGNYKKEISEETIRKSKETRATPEYKAKMSAINARRWSDPGAHRRMSERFSGKNNPAYGKPATAEKRDRARKSFAAHVDSLKKEVLCVETGKCYPSVADASRESGINRVSISACCRGRYKTAGNLHWEFAS